MNTDFTICVGTVGAGVWFSPDGGEHWRRSRMNLPFEAEPGEIQIRSLAVSAHNPHHVLAGSEAGLYLSEDNGAQWNLIESPAGNRQIWSVAFHPDNHRVAVCYVNAKVVSIYDTEKGELVANLPVGPTSNAVAAWHPDGTRLAVGSSRFIQIWDVKTRRKKAQSAQKECREHLHRR